MSTRKIIRNEDDECRPNDRLLCTLCNIYFNRSDRTHHNRTRAHKRLLERSDMIKTIIEGERTKPKILSSNKFKEHLAVKEIKKMINE